MLSDSFLMISRVWGPVFNFNAPGRIFGGTEGIGSRFQVPRSQTHVRLYRGHQVKFSSSTPPNTFSAVLRVSGPTFKFRALGLIFSGTESARSSCQIACSRVLDSFSGVHRVWRHVFKFRAIVLVFCGNEDVGSYFTSFVLPDLFSAIP
jgi:hypothetical protein